VLSRHREAADAVRALKLGRPRVLDVGCRDGALAECLPEAHVVGLDLAGTPDVVAALPRLPFGDRAFDAVCALDVLEHCDDLRGAFHECLRVADRLLLLSLPNMAHPLFRWRFARTGRLSGKYDLHDARQADRHRWFTPLAQGDALVGMLAEETGCRLAVSRLTEGRRAGVLAALLRPIGAHPQLWAWTSLYALTR
jgi:SAM-dependent methyltransferase